MNTLIKNNYFTDNSTTYDARKSFFTDIENLFHPYNENKIIWDDEEKNIAKFFSEYPVQFHEEMFFKITEIYLKNNINRENADNFHKTNSFFLQLIKNDIFSNFLPNIGQNVDYKSIVAMVSKSLSLDYINIAKDYTDLFLSNDNKQIRYFDTTVSKLIKTRSKGAIYFLLDNYNGWHSKSILSILLSYESIDDSLMDKITSKIGKFTNENIDVLISALNINGSSNLPANRQKEILEKYSDHTSYNHQINLFYLKNIESGEFSYQQLLDSKSKFIELTNSEDYLKQWIVLDPNVFVSTYLPLLLSKNILSKETIEKNYIEFLLSPIFPAYNQHQKPTLAFARAAMTYLKSSWNDSNWQNILINQYKNEPSIVNNEIINNYKNIDFNLPINIKVDNVTFSSLSQFLEKQDNIIYKLYKFSIEDNARKKDELFTNIEHSISNFNVQALMGIEYVFISSSFTEQLYNYALKKEENTESFFEKWFVKKQCSELSIDHLVRQSFLNLFKYHKPTITFDLKKTNPLFDFLEERIHQPSDTLSYVDTKFFIELNEYFEKKVMFLERNGKSLYEYCKENNILHDNVLTSLSKESQPFKRKFLNLFYAGKETPLQIQCNKQGIKIITDPSNVIEIKSNGNDTNIPANTSMVNNFHELQNQVKNDLNGLNKVLDKYSDKNLNIEIKIRAENLLLNNITFLESIKSSSDLINFEDTFFLKNNLGKYLIQAIESYGKSISRYEVLLDPTNKTAFSKQSEEELERYKEKIDNETLKQLSLLEKELDVVKKHILNQFSSDLLKEMEINTRILENKIEHNSNVHSIDIIEINKRTNKI